MMYKNAIVQGKESVPNPLTYKFKDQLIQNTKDYLH